MAGSKLRWGVALLIPLGLIPAVSVAQNGLVAPSLASYDVEATGFTVECWVRVRTQPGFDPRIIRCVGPTEGPCGDPAVDVWELFICKASACTPGRPHFLLQQGQSCDEVEASADVADGNFHHIAGTYDGTNLRIYVDGTLSGSTNAPGRVLHVAGGSLVVGNSTQLDNAFDGLIDEVRVWSVPRSQTEIARDMLTEIAPQPGLSGYWRLNGLGLDEIAGNTLQPSGAVDYGPGRLSLAADIGAGCNSCFPVPGSFVGVYGDPEGTQSCINFTGVVLQLYLWANLNGATAEGITGVEFRIVATDPAGYIFLGYTPPTITLPASNSIPEPGPVPDPPGDRDPGWRPPPGGGLVVVGSPMDLTPNIDDATGVNLAFPCQSGVAGRLFLGSLLLLNTDSQAGSTDFLVTNRFPPTSPNFPRPLFTLCDSPEFSKSSMDSIGSYGGATIAFRTVVRRTQWDEAVDFSNTVNPASPWSYGWSEDLAGPFHLFAQGDTSVVCPTVFQWYEPIASDPAPSINHNQGGATTCGSIQFQAGDVAGLPGPSGEYSVLRWTAPSSGFFMVDGSFTALDLQSDLVDVHVLQNATSLFSGVVGGTAGTTNEFHFCRLFATSGDVIDFVVGSGGDGYVHDMTAIQAHIAPPLQSTDRGGRTIEIPSTLKLYPNVPNPFNPTTRIEFDLGQSGYTTLQIYDVAGHLLRNLLRRHLTAGGRHQVMWDGLDDAGRPVASGVYFCKLVSGSSGATRRLVLIR